MAGKIYKLDSSGHGEVASWGEDAVSREAGAAAFQALADKGFTMFDVSDPLKGKPALRTFDPEVAEIIAVPQLVGG